MSLTLRLPSSSLHATSTCTRLAPRLPSSRRESNPISRKTGRRYNATIADPPIELPLAGVRVLELGQLIAGPFAGQLLGHFGAEVIKVEPPKIGDPLRVWRELDLDGTSPWFRSIGRNKKSVTIDLRQERGRQYVS